MLQFPKYYEKCHRKYFQQQEIPSISGSISKLTHIIAIEKKREIGSGDFINQNLHRLDQLLWTNKMEYMDRYDFPVLQKKKIVDAIHKKNILFATYKKLFNLILPYIQATNQHENRACRILEIAGGSGQLAFYIAKKARKYNLPVEITSSDIVNHYMLAAENQKQLQNEPRIQFRQINALKLTEIPQGQYDLIINLHTMHHFLPEELATILQSAQKIAKVFVAIDAYRGIGNMCFIAACALAQSMATVNFMYFHDAWISARKMYPEKLLETIAKIACNRSKVFAKHISLGLSALVVEV